MPGGSVSRLASARSRLESACRLLITASPEAVECCEALLATTLNDLDEVRQHWLVTAPDRKEAAELQDLRGHIRMARHLLENGIEYHGKWHRLVATMAGGYTAEGTPPPLCQGGQISLAG